MTREEGQAWIDLMRSGKIKQAFGNMFNYKPNGDIERACGLGCLIMTQKKTAKVHRDCILEAALNLYSVIELPEADRTGSKHYFIPYLNDALRLTLPQIADMVEYFILPHTEPAKVITVTEEQQVLGDLELHGWEPVEQPAEHALTLHT